MPKMTEDNKNVVEDSKDSMKKIMMMNKKKLLNQSLN